jgi:type I restriction enzyme S subunit
MTAWPTVALGDLCDVSAGGTPSRANAQYFGGGIPWVKIGDLRQGTVEATEESITSAGLDNSSAKLLPPGTVLISIFATIGRTAVLGIEAATNQAIAGLTPRDPERLRPDYLRRYLDSIVSTLEGRARGVAQLNIGSGILRSILVPLPSPPEQKRIADLLEKADALRTKRRAALTELDTLTQSIFLEVFGDPATNPKGFPIKPLTSLIRDDDSINYGVLQPGDDVGAGIPLVRVGDLRGGRVSHTALKRIDPSIEAAYKRSRLRGDEILLSCVGTIGVVALADELTRGFNIARAVARIPVSPATSRVFLGAYLRTDFVQRYFISELRTVSQPTLNIKQLSETAVVLPPIELQRKFEAKVSAVERVKTSQLSAMTGLNALFDSVQNRAFRGEL